MNQSSTQAKENLTFDPDALREKYRVERDKRLRKDGNEQYLQAKGDFTHYVDDPYISERLDRDALMDEMDVIIIGGGFGGLISAARLREAGVKRIRIIEKGGHFVQEDKGEELAEKIASWLKS